MATRGEATSKVFARIQLTDGGENLCRGKQAAVAAPSWGQELPGSFPHPMKLWDAEVHPRITCWREQILPGAAQLRHKPCSASQGCWGAQRVGTERHGKKPRAQRASPGQGHCKSTLVEEPQNTSGNSHFALPFCRHTGKGDPCRNPSSVGHRESPTEQPRCPPHHVAGHRNLLPLRGRGFWHRPHAAAPNPAGQT